MQNSKDKHDVFVRRFVKCCKPIKTHSVCGSKFGPSANSKALQMQITPAEQLECKVMQTIHVGRREDLVGVAPCEA